MKVQLDLFMPVSIGDHGLTEGIIVVNMFSHFYLQSIYIIF